MQRRPATRTAATRLIASAPASPTPACSAARSQRQPSADAARASLQPSGSPPIVVKRHLQQRRSTPHPPKNHEPEPATALSGLEQESNIFFAGNSSAEMRPRFSRNDDGAVSRDMAIFGDLADIRCSRVIVRQGQKRRCDLTMDDIALGRGASASPGNRPVS